MSDKMREEFEAWHRTKYQTKYQTGQPTRDMHNGVYDEKYGPDEQQERWEIWQDSRAALVIELPSPSQFDGHQPALVIQECQEAVEAAGVRAKS